MQINQGFAVGGAGYVRAVFSRRARGHAAPVDLLRVVLRVACLVAVRERLRREFAGYLVTEPEALPVWRIDGRVVVLGADPALRYVCGLSDDFGDVFSMDAPNFLPAGSVRKYAPEGAENVCGDQRRILRERWAA